MKKSKIKVFAMRCSEDSVYKGRIEEIDNTLEAKQEFVGGGLIQNLVIDGIDVICNDDGKIKNFPFNRVWIGDGNEVYDIFVGDIFACNHDQHGNYTDINESDIPILLEHLKAILLITSQGGVLCLEEEDLEYYGEKHIGEECIFIDSDNNIVTGLISNKTCGLELIYEVTDANMKSYTVRAENCFSSVSVAESYLRRKNE